MVGVLESREQLVAYLMELLDATQKARVKVEVAQLVQTKRRTLHLLLIQYGKCLGVLELMQRSGYLSDTQYEQYKNQAGKTMNPSVVEL